VYLDTFGDSRHGYEFLVNARGIQMDAYRSEGQPEDFLWDASWTSAGRVTDDGWEVEARIPLNNLRFPKKQMQEWKFLLVRIHPSARGRVNIGNLKMDYANPCLVCQFSSLEGFEGIKAGRNLEITPTFTSHYTDRPLQLRSHKDASADVGVDIKWGITPTTEVEVTAHPDFSQIESDINQLAVNNRFVVSLPERRPFFLESSNAFAARGTVGGFSVQGVPGGITGGNSGQPLNLFYSRSIAEPLIAGKFFQMNCSISSL